MPTAHAKLSPSAAERWIECPASIRMEVGLLKEGIVEPESVYAREGTAAHALGELKARWLILKEFTAEEYEKAHTEWGWEYEDVLSLPDVDVEQMEDYTDAYVDLIEERLALYPHSQLLLEQRVQTGVPTCWGTSDVVIVSPYHVEIIDLKYGSGVFVEVIENPQTRLYAVGALENIADLLGNVKLVRITIHQPRMNNTATEEISPAELRKWRDSIIPVAEEALGDHAHFGPSESACRWCPASGRCKAQLEDIFGTDFSTNPDAMDEEDMADALSRVKRIKQWLEALEVAALDAAYSRGKTIPGYKVILSGGQRSVRDPARAIEVLREAGYDDDQIGQFKVKGIGELEKLLKEDFKPLLEDSKIVQKSEGRPSLALESDKRPAINPNSEAQKEFT